MQKTAHCSSETREDAGTESPTLDDIIDRYQGEEDEIETRGEQEE